MAGGGIVCAEVTCDVQEVNRKGGDDVQLGPVGVVEGIEQGPKDESEHREKAAPNHSAEKCEHQPHGLDGAWRVSRRMERQCKALRCALVPHTK